MFFESLAYAQADPAAAPTGMFGAFGSFLPLILIFVVFYFLMIRPQQKKQKTLIAMIDSLKVGDEVLTNAGIFGIISSVIDINTFLVEIAPGVKIKLSKGSIASRVDQNTPSSMSSTSTKSSSISSMQAPTEPTPTGIGSKRKKK